MKLPKDCRIAALLLFITSVVYAESQSAEGAAPSEISVLIVGNSYTKRFELNLAELITKMSAGTQTKIVAMARYKSNSTLHGHWKPDLEKNIAAGAFHAIVLQDYSSRPITDFEMTREAVGMFQKAIAASKSKGFLFLPWAPKKTPDDLDKLDQALAKLGQEFDMTVVPFGRAWKHALTEKPELVLYERDGAHPAPFGFYLNACVLYACLTGTSPEGLPDGGIKDLDDSTRTYLQALAWRVVSEQARHDTPKESRTP